MEFWWIPFISIVGSFAVTIVIVMSIARTRQRRAELQAQVQSKLIDRFESGPELVDFLRSQTGREFVSGVKVTQTAAVNRKLLGSIRTAVFFAVLGIGFLILWGLSGQSGFMYPGVILMTLGAGFFVSTMVSLRLSRDWGLNQPEDGPAASAGDVR
jgi:hypothetical protein